MTLGQVAYEAYINRLRRLDGGRDYKYATWDEGVGHEIWEAVAKAVQERECWPVA